MARKKKSGPRIREAKPSDLGLFRKLWKEFLIEQEKAGDFTVPSDDTMKAFESLFEHYTEGNHPGVVLFAGDYAVLMWGSAGESPLESKLTPFVQGWGTYIQKEYQGKGLGPKMYETARQKMKELGIKHVVATYSYKNTAVEKAVKKVGFKPTHALIVLEV